MISSKKESIEREVLAQAGVRAEPAGWKLVPLKWTPEMRAAWDRAPFNEDDDIEFNSAYRAMIDAAPTIPAQVPAAEVRAQALEEAAEIALRYVGCEGIAERIRSLAQSSTADKASEVRAAEQDAQSQVDEVMAAIQHACGLLPVGYEVILEMENGAGGVVWVDDEGNRHIVDGEGYITQDIYEAVEKALAHAAAPSTADSGNTGALGEGAEA